MSQSGDCIGVEVVMTLVVLADNGVEVGMTLISVVMALVVLADSVDSEEWQGADSAVAATSAIAMPRFWIVHELPYVSWITRE